MASRKQQDPKPALPSTPPPSLSIDERIAMAGGLNGVFRLNRTILLHSLITRDLNSAFEMLKRGADPNITDEQGRSPLFYAVGSCYRTEEDLTHTMHTMRPANSARAKEDFDAKPSTPDQKLIKKLLQAGANPNAISKNQGTPLESALFYRNNYASFMLLKSGADPDLLSDKGKALLAHQAGDELSLLEKFIMLKTTSASLRNPAISRSGSRL